MNASEDLGKRLAGATVLLVDDDAPLRRATRRVLENAGAARVVEAADGEAGVEAARDPSLDAVVLDVDMPRMDGLTACARIRQNPEVGLVPILFMTSSDREVTALSAGGDDFVHKPVKGAVLVARLGGLIRRYRAERDNGRLIRMLQGYVPSPVQHGPRASEALDATILFSDLRGFTAVSFTLEPRQLFDAISEVLGHQATCIEAAGGYVDKFSGDGLLAVFEGDDSTDRACDAAKAILDWAASYRAIASWERPPVGLGIHAGSVVRGNLGGSGRREYTVLGSVVNTAARLCGSASAMEAIASATVRERARRHRFAELPSVHLKGIAGPTPAFRLERASSPE